MASVTPLSAGIGIRLINSGQFELPSRRDNRVTWRDPSPDCAAHSPTPLSLIQDYLDRVSVKLSNPRCILRYDLMIIFLSLRQVLPYQRFVSVVSQSSTIRCAKLSELFAFDHHTQSC